MWGLSSGNGAVFAYFCLVVSVGVHRFCSLFCPHCMWVSFLSMRQSSCRSRCVVVIFRGSCLWQGYENSLVLGMVSPFAFVQRLFNRMHVEESALPSC